MTDKEMVILCAKAIGWNTDAHPIAVPFDPLNNDAHAMAMIKCLELEIVPPFCRAMGNWRASPRNESHSARDMDLNRAIVECVAKMQKQSAVMPHNSAPC